MIELNGTSAGAGWVSGLTLAAGSSGSTIKGLAINRFSGDGILIQTSNNVVTGNFLGTDATGTLARGNSMGLVLDTGSTNNRIGGTTAAERNIISGNTIDGIEVMGATTTNNLVQGNYIGVDATGTADLGNVGNGVAIFSAAANNTIGGTAAGAGNVISGNDGYGIGISAGGATANIVQGNRIGTNAAGTAGVGNSKEGIYISGGAGNTVVGGIAAGAGNTIAYNTLDGVALKADASTGNSIRGNAIFSNGGLGIDLGDNGLTANDTGDGDTGPNNLQNAPVLSGDDIVGGNITIGGKLNSTASTTFTIDFYASTSADPSGYGEGQRYLGSTTATTSAGGNVVFSVTLAAAVSAGEFITATATSPTGNTSEFSMAIGTDTLVVDTTSDASNGTVTSIAALLANRGADGLISLREAIAATNGSANGAAPDQIVFNIAPSGVQTITVASALPQITGAVIINGTSEPGFAGTPLIEINGNNAVTDALVLNAGGSGSTIQGLAINRFTGNAIQLNGSSNNVIKGNFIGTNAAGTAGLGNRVGVDITGTATNNVIGGTTAADRNLISANTNDGLTIRGVGASNNLVRGNYIGLDVTGTVDLGNSAQGLSIWAGATNNTIGGTAAGAGNVISGNNGEGVRITDTGTTGNVVQGNLIGTNAAGTAGIGNSQKGLSIGTAAANNTIGGTAAGAGNTIAYNGWAGLALVANAGTGNSLLGNAIYSNGNLGIDLSDNGVTANDGARTAGQPNMLMDFPVIQSAGFGGTTLSVSGYVGTAPNDTDFAGARIEFFRSPDAAGANGEADLYLGFLTADASGNFSGNLTVAGLALGDRVTATATDTSNNTSELGVNVTVASAPPTAGNDAYSVNEDSTLTVDWWNTSWQNRKKITFNNTNSAENLTNFPVLVRLSSSNIDFAKIKAAGADIRFLDANGTPLAYQIESWDDTPGSESATVWVRVPQIDAGSNTDSIWIYYNNTGAADAQNAAGVWDANFAGVWHLNQGTGVTAVDSTSNANNGTPQGSPTASTGEIGGALTFATSRLVIAADATLDLSTFSNWTMSAWVKPTTYAGTSWPIDLLLRLIPRIVGPQPSRGGDRRPN